MRRIAAALTLTALVLAGCGGDDSSSSDPSSSSSSGSSDSSSSESGSSDPSSSDPSAPASPEGGSGACPFVETAVLEEAFGVEMEELYGNEDGCQIGTADGELAVVVTHIDIAIDPEQYAEESTASCDEGTVVEVDAGDRAYACQAIGPTASVFEGDALVNLGVLFADDEQAVIDAFVEVLPSVTVDG